MRDIVVEQINPPHTSRSFDWQAFREGWDLGEPIGYGSTPEEAIDDLISLENE